MRIRTQNALGILPLFLGLAAALGALVYSLVQREWTEGFVREGQAVALTAAEYLDPHTLARFEDGSLPAGETDALRRGFEHMFDAGRVQRILLYRPATGEVLLDLGPWSGRWAGAGASVSGPTGFRVRSSGERFLRAAEPVTRADGSPGAWRLVVELDLSSLDWDLSELRMKIGAGVGLTVLLGLVCTGWVTGSVRRRLAVLERGFGRGESETVSPVDAPPGRTIREISDLANTYNTMVSILDRGVQRSRKDVLEAEQYRTPEEALRTYQTLTAAPRSVQGEGIAAAGRPVGPGAPGRFFDLFAAGDRVIGLLGRVDEADPLRASVAADAVVDFARHRLQQRDPSAALRELGQLFRLAEGRVFVARPGREALDLFRWNAAGGMVELDSQPLAEDGATPIHDLPGEAVEPLAHFLASLADLDPAAAAKEAARLMSERDPELRGHLLLFWRLPLPDDET